jgi:hypothetical protein
MWHFLRDSLTPIVGPYPYPLILLFSHIKRVWSEAVSDPQHLGEADRTGSFLRGAIPHPHFGRRVKCGPLSTLDIYFTKMTETSHLLIFSQLVSRGAEAACSICRAQSLGVFVFDGGFGHFMK